MHELVVCVVGLSNNEKESFGTHPGIGKSCLCFRFAYPGYDNYIEDHPSLFALHEFENPVINSTHFLYWGSPAKEFAIRGGEVKVRFHLLEHTVFYQDITSRPFHGLTHPDNVDAYKKRIVGSIESSGKLSFHARDDIFSTDRYTKFQYPSNLTKVARGYVVAFDVSLAESELEMQCKRVEPILEHLCKTKKKVVMAATKRDCHKLMSLQKARELHRRFKVPLVETSASDNLNVEEVFRVLTKQALGKKVNSLSDRVIGYDEAASHSLIQRGMAKRGFLSYVRKRCRDCDDRLASVQSTPEFQECASTLGSYQAGRIFAQNALELYNLKVDRYAGVSEDHSLRQEFLEDFIEGRADLAPYRSELRM